MHIHLRPYNTLHYTFIKKIYNITVNFYIFFLYYQFTYFYHNLLSLKDPNLFLFFFTWYNDKTFQRGSHKMFIYFNFICFFRLLKFIYEFWEFLFKLLFRTFTIVTKSMHKTWCWFRDNRNMTYIKKNVNE